MSAPTRNFRITDDADADLRGIAAYIACESPAASVRVFEALQATFRRLADGPELGERCDHLGHELRQFIPRRPAHRYVVFYRLSPVGMRIDSVGVIHSARDIGELLRGR